MELTVENIIKIIVGVLVVAVVAYGIYYFFTNYVIDFFRNMGGNSTAKLLMSLIY
jgi:hypothetical protein